MSDEDYTEQEYRSTFAMAGKAIDERDVARKELARLRAELGAVSEKLMIAGTDLAGVRAERDALAAQVAAVAKQRDVAEARLVETTRIVVEDVPDLEDKLAAAEQQIAALRAALVESHVATGCNCREVVTMDRCSLGIVLADTAEAARGWVSREEHERELKLERVASRCTAHATQVAALRAELGDLIPPGEYAGGDRFSPARTVLADTAAAAKGWRGPEVVRALLEALRRAVEWMADDGCDCGTDEPGTCALCVARAAIAAAEKGE